MSTLAKTYALACGVKLDKIQVWEQFFPLDHPLDKCIFLHASAGGKDANNQPLFPSKIYDHWEDVFRILAPILEKESYRVFQIGVASDPVIPRTTSLCGSTTMKQTAYLLRRCAALVGNDSMNVHLAGSFDTPLVAIYGPTDPKNHGPEWFNPDKTVLIESHRFGAKRPTYSAFEQAKTINAIPPEQIANALLKILGLPQVEHQTYCFGALYKNQIIDIVPDTILRPDFFPNVPVNVRLDYQHEEAGLLANIKQRRCLVFAEKPFDLNILRENRSNLAFCRVKVGDGITPQFAKELIRIGAPCVFFTEEEDQQKLKEIRYEFLDVCLIEKAVYTTVDTFWDLSDRYTNSKLDRNVNLSKLAYKSNKYIVSAKGIYLSRVSWEKKKNAIPNLGENSQLIGDLAKEPGFWKELQHFYIHKS